MFCYIYMTKFCIGKCSSSVEESIIRHIRTVKFSYVLPDTALLAVLNVLTIDHLSRSRQNVYRRWHHLEVNHQAIQKNAIPFSLWADTSTISRTLPASTNIQAAWKAEGKAWGYLLKSRCVNQNLHNGLKEIMLKERETILYSVPPNPFRVSIHAHKFTHYIYSIH